MLESLFNKVAGLQASNFIQKRLQPPHVLSCETCKILKKNYFAEHLLATASVCQSQFSTKTLMLVWVVSRQKQLSGGVLS